MTALRLGTALFAAALLGCEPPKPPPPVPPTVDLSLPSANVAGTSMRVRITVTGCAQVSSVTVTDRDQPLTIPPFVSNPLEFDLTKDNVSFAQGVRARLLLKATATCADGTSGESIPVGGSFFPVAQVITPSTGGTATSAVPDVFYVDEPTAGTVTFFGCMTLTNGTRAIAKTDTTGAMLGAVGSVPFPCRAHPDVTLTGRIGATWHWLFDLAPGTGAYAWNNTPAAGNVYLTNIRSLAPGLGGDALTLKGDSSYIQRYRPNITSGAAGRWDADGSTAFEGVWAQYQQWLGAPRAVAGTAQKFFFSAFFDNGTGIGNTEVWEIAEGSDARFPAVTRYTGHFVTEAPSLTSAFNKAATTIYYAKSAGTAGTSIVSCAARANNCASKKTAPINLPAPITILAVFANDTRLLAASDRQAWVLDASTLAILNPGGDPFITTGALVWKYLDFGPPSGEQVILMSGPTSSALPTEVVVYDSAATGELYRFETPADSLYLALDSTGQGWMRHGAKLLKLLPAADYKQLKTR